MAQQLKANKTIVFVFVLYYQNPYVRSPVAVTPVPSISCLILPSVGTVYRHIQGKEHITNYFLMLEKEKNEII